MRAAKTQQLVYLRVLRCLLPRPLAWLAELNLSFTSLNFELISAQGTRLGILPKPSNIPPGALVQGIRHLPCRHAGCDPKINKQTSKLQAHSTSVYLFYLGGSEGRGKVTLGDAQEHCWVCVQGTYLVVLREHYMVPGISTRFSTACISRAPTAPTPSPVILFL